MASPGSSPPSLSAQSSSGPATSGWANLVKEYLDWHESITKTDSRPYAVLTASSTQTLTAATNVAITFDTEVADVGNGHSGSSATYTIPTAGLWVFTAVATWQSTTTANAVNANIYQNAAVIARDSRLGTGSAQSLTLSAYAVCAAGDTIQLQQYSAAASSTDITLVHPTLACYRLNS